MRPPIFACFLRPYPFRLKSSRIDTRHQSDLDCSWYLYGLCPLQGKEEEGDCGTPDRHTACEAGPLSYGLPPSSPGHFEVKIHIMLFPTSSS
ncbi:hypothetical protein VTK73DRAFT_1750 [Phialemonium thermophilum]|uniref:Uncharacterized protein n=1 Tax=Phialemonium thermophilum TaxID=223376 RepID=A0ABR3X8E3_9PEZI